MVDSTHLHLSTLHAPDPGAIARSASLARQLGAELEVSIARVDLPQPSHWAAGHVAPAVLEIDSQADLRVEQLVREAQAAAEERNLTIRLQRFSGGSVTTDERAALLARTHDFTMVSLGEGDADARRTVEALTFASGRGVLVWPAGRDARLPFETVMVAWDYSEAAARAVAFALPLLKRARQVEVVTVRGGKAMPIEQGHERVMAYLQRHGVMTVSRTPDAAGRKIGPYLGDLAEELKARLLVMGAYDTPKARELLFGGVTRSVLQRPAVPLFLAN